MVHVRKCPCKYGRGKPTTEFYKDGKPQIYCYGRGWDKDDLDTALECCKQCPDWVYGTQIDIDYENAKGGGDNVGDDKGASGSVPEREG